MTPYSKVYKAFLAKINEEEWDHWLLEEAQQDWREIMESALPNFKFPRIDLDRNDEGFSGDLGQEEIQIIAHFMKVEWLNRCILTWENIKPLYVERDFSQANLLDKLNATFETQMRKAEDLESKYYRSIKGKPFHYSKLATRVDG